MKPDPTPFLKQFKHNEYFHGSICENYPTEVWDWKITIIFYCAYHLIQSLAAHKKIEIGNRHSEILRNIKPSNPDRKLQIKRDAFYAYDQLFEYSQTARYKGFLDFEHFQELKKADYEDAIKKYEYLKKYIKEQGVNIE